MGTKRSTKWYRKNEEEVMRKLGFTPTKNSGAGWVEKEDGQNEQCICQLKSTDAMSISVKQNDLHVLENNASISHKLPVFAIQFINTGETWIMLKPEHIQLIKRVLNDENVSEELKNEFSDLFDVDKEQDKEYNVLMGGRGAGRTYLARMQYTKQMEEEKKREQEERKQRTKERSRKNWQKRNSNKKG